MRSCKNVHRDFKGIWIPKEIWLSEDLTPMEIIVLAELYSLCGENGCTASDNYLKDFFGISRTAVQNHLSSLRQKGYITTETFNGRNRQINVFLDSRCQETLTADVRKTGQQVSEKSNIYYTKNKEDKKDYNNKPSAEKEKILPLLIDLCDKINYMPRDKTSFAREMKAAKELLALTEDMVKHYGGNDVIGTITWMTEQAKKMKASGHWYLKSKPIKPSTLRYCFDELTTAIVDEKKRQEESIKFFEEHEKLKIREVSK